MRSERRSLRHSSIEQATTKRIHLYFDKDDSGDVVTVFLCSSRQITLQLNWCAFG